MSQMKKAPVNVLCPVCFAVLSKYQPEQVAHAAWHNRQNEVYGHIQSLKDELGMLRTRLDMNGFPN